MKTSFREKRLMPIISKHEEKIGSKFTPNKDTYLKLGIAPKRLGMLLKGEARTPLQIGEIISLSSFLKIETSEFFN